MEFLSPAEELAQEGKYVKAVIAHVEAYHTVSMIELEEFLSTFIEVKGGQNLHVHNYKNLVIWGEVSKQFCEIVQQALATEKIVPTPSPMLVYMFDGRVLPLPIAQRFMEYKEPHWIPIVLNPKREEPKKKPATKRRK
jgi:hypothetical protein